MLDAVKGVLARFFAPACQHCGETIRGPYVRERVKVPGYTGRHEKAFCGEAHLRAWRDRVAAYEERFGEIPDGNVGPACGGC